MLLGASFLSAVDIVHGGEGHSDKSYKGTPDSSGVCEDEFVWCFSYTMRERSKEKKCFIWSSRPCLQLGASFAAGVVRNLG